MLEKKTFRDFQIKLVQVVRKEEEKKVGDIAEDFFFGKYLDRKKVEDTFTFRIVYLLLNKNHKMIYIEQIDNDPGHGPDKPTHVSKHGE